MNKFPVNVDLGLLITRLMLAAVGIFHGGQKLFGIFGGGGIQGTAKFFEGLNIPAPTLGAVAAGSAEFFGGILLGLGLFSRIGGMFLAFTMYVAVLTVHRHAFDAAAGGMEFPLTLAVVATALVVSGPGKYAITRRI